MKILRAIETLDPRRGGPAAGLRAITPALQAAGHETEFVSMDDPATVAEFKAGVPVHALGPTPPGYGTNARLIPWLRENRHRFDAVFVHGLWQFHGWAVRSALEGQQPYFVFPHGMLDPWFRNAYPVKHAKKWVYWQLRERRVLREAASVLFTCEEERRLAQKTFTPYRATERVVAYGTSAPTGDPQQQREVFLERFPALQGRPYLLFLGRLHPKKGVDLLVNAYGRLATEAAAARRPFPTLVIAGPPGEATWQRELEAVARALPAPCSVHWVGMLEGAAKWGALRGADAFVLPSHQENFGIAVAEALAVGTPVLISNKVNICTEIAADGAGLVEADTLDGTAALLRRWAELDQTARSAMRIAAADMFRNRYEVSRVASSLIETITPFLRRRAT